MMLRCCQIGLECSHQYLMQATQCLSQAISIALDGQLKVLRCVDIRFPQIPVGVQSLSVVGFCVIFFEEITDQIHTPKW